MSSERGDYDGWDTYANGVGQNRQSSGQQDTTEWRKKARLTSYRLAANGKARHQTREFSWEHVPELAVDCMTWKEPSALCVKSTGGSMV